ncbi:hypothetical protein HDV01_003340 [Terramyces sp. JEL0728]|nr:hypothetical protein HDV01_003340 [Terramyces sp. JEL0728]
MILLPEEQRCIEKSCDGAVLASTVARLYQATNAKEYSHSFTGGLALYKNKNSGEFNFSIVDLKNCMIGFSFADEDDALVFHDAFSQRERDHIRSVSSASTTNANQSSPSLDSGLDRRKSKKESTGFGLFRKNTKTKEKKLDKAMISGPSDFQHVSHVGYSKADGFSVQNIPMEWKIIFQKAGITDEQLQDKKQQKVIKKFMKENAGLLASSSIEAPTPPALQPNASQSAAQQPAKRPAVAPPAIPGRVPHPAIPSRNQPSGATPPPPPPPPDFSNAPPPPIHVTPARAPAQPAKQATPAKAQPGDLLSQIRQGTQLKSAADNPIQQEAPKGTGDAIADALRDALQKRITAVTGGSGV